MEEMYLTVQEAAKRSNVCDQMIRIHIKNGLLIAHKVTTGKKKSHYRIHIAAFDDYMSKKYENITSDNIQKNAGIPNVGE